MGYLKNKIDSEKVIANEVERLSKKYNKDYLDCQDLVTITSLGRDNVLKMMGSKGFPVLKVGKRRVVSVVSFVKWMIENNRGGLYG